MANFYQYFKNNINLRVTARLAEWFKESLFQKRSYPTDISDDKPLNSCKTSCETNTFDLKSKDSIIQTPEQMSLIKD